MSRAIKITTLDQAEAQIDRQQRQLRNLESQLANVANQARTEAERAAESKVKDLKIEMDYQISGLESDMAEMEQSHRSAMKKQAEDFNKGLNELQDWTETLVDQLENRVNESFKKQQAQITNIKQSVNQLYQKEADEQKRAVLMIKDLDILLRTVNEKTNHEKYAPGRLKSLQNRFSQLRDGSLPAASLIALALSLTNDLWELEEEILKNKMRFEAMHNFVLKEAEELLKTMHKNRSDIFFTDEEGNKMEDQEGNSVRLELDYWTKGEYSLLEQQAEKLRSDLEKLKESPKLTEEVLKEILNNLGCIKSDQNELVKIALKRGIASEQRIAISSDIINAMINQGFELKSLSNGDPAHNYLGGETETDQREGVFAILTNGNGTEISLIIHPDEGLTNNHIIFQRNDDSSLNESELRRSIDAVKTIIEKQGYTMGDIASPVGTGDNTQSELADGNALQKVGLKKELKKQLGFIGKEASK